MAQLKAGLSPESKNQILEQVKDLISQIENDKISLELNDNIKEQLNTVKETINSISDDIKPIDIKVNTSSIVKGADEVKGTIDQIKSQLAEIDGVKNVKINVQASGIDEDTKQINSFIAEIRTAQGEIKKLQFDAGNLTGMSKGEEGQYSFSDIKGLTDNTQAVAQKEAIQEENQALQESLDLLKQDYNLEQQINSAKEKGKQATVDELTAQKEAIETQIGESTNGLNEDSLAKITEQAGEYQNKLNVSIAETTDKESQVAIQAEKSLEIFKQQADIKINNANNSMIGVKFDTTGIKAQIEQIQSEINSLNANEFNSNVSAKINTDLKEVTSNIGTLKAEARDSGGVFSDLLMQTTKFASWMASATLFMGAIDGIKTMVTNVETLDSQLTQLSYVSNMSTEQMNNFARSEIGVAQSMGSTVDTVREASRIFTNLNSTTAQVLENTKAATAFSNVTGTDIESSASALQSVTNQFTEMQGKTMQAGDAITKVAANLSMDFQTASTNIASAVKTSGSALSEAGMSFNQYVGLIGAAEEKTQLSGETLGNAYKTMAARINQVKTDDLTPTTDEMANAEKALNEIGISIRATDGTLNPLSTTLQSLGEKWDSLNNVQKQNIGYYVAGTRQISILDATMGSYSKSVELSNVAQNSSGNLMQENAKYADSFAGRVNTLVATWQGFSTQLINDNWLKGTVSGLTSLSYGIKDLVSFTPLLTVAMIALFMSLEKVALANNFLWIGTLQEAIPALIAEIGALGGIVAGAAVKLNVATAAAGLFTASIETLGEVAEGAIAALATNPLTYIVALTAAVAAGISVWQQQKQVVEDTAKAYKDYQSAMSKNDVSGIQSSVSTMQQYLNTMKNLYETYQKDSSSTNPIDKAKSLYDLSEINNEKKALDEAGYKYDETTGKIKQLKTAQDQLAQDKNMSTAQRELESSSDTLNSSTGKLIDSYMKLSAQQDKGSVEKKEQADDVKQLTGTYTDLKAGVDKSGNSIITNTDALDKDTEALIENKGAVTSDTTQIKSLSDVENDLGTALSKAKGNLDTINSALATHATTGKYDADTLEQLAEKYPQLLSLMGNDAAITQELKTLKQQETDAATSSISDQMTAIENSINDKLKDYGIDLKNFTSAEEAKTAVAKAEAQKRTDAEFADADKKSANGDQAGASKEAQLAERQQQKINAGQVSASSDDADLIDQYFTEKTMKAGTDKLLADVAQQAQEKAQTAANKSDTTAENKAKEAQEKQLEGQVKDIEAEKSTYDTNADNEYKVEQQQEDAIIKGYQDQLDALKAKKQLETDNNELLKDQNDLIKDQQDLQNAQNEKNVRVYENGQWQWEADQTAVSKAQDTLSEAQQTLKTKQSDMAEQAQETALSNTIQAEQDKKSAYATNYQNQKDATDQNYQSQEDTLNQRKEDLQGYAEGTDNATPGDKQVAENGIEILVGNQVKNFQGGEQVLNNSQTQQILSRTSNQGVSNASTSATNPIVSNTKKVLGDIDDSISDFVDNSGDYSKQTEINMGQSVTNNKQLLEKPITDLKNEIISQITQFINGAGQYSITANKNIGDGINNSAPTVINPTTLLLGNLKNLITTFATGVMADGQEIDTQLGKGVTEGVPDLQKNIDDLCTKIIDQFHKDLGIHSPSTIAYSIGQFWTQGLINGMDEADIEKFISDKVGTMTNAFGGVSNVSGNVKDWLTQAMKLDGVDASQLPMLETIAEKESSGNPNSINLTDSNALAGHPSKGLMQMIDSTFQEYALAGHGNIMNPIDNAAAAIKYMEKRYGSISNVPGIKSMANGGGYVGYIDGTDNATAGVHPLSEDGKPELVVGKQYREFEGGEQVLNNGQLMNLLSNNLSNSLSNPMLPTFTSPNLGDINIPSKEIANNQSTVVNVQNVNMPDGTNAEQMVEQLRQLSYTTPSR